MTTPITCPDAKQLQDLLEGRLSGGSEVELVEHLNQCDSCPRKLETMAEGGMPLADSVKKLSREVPSSDSAYWAQLRQIRQELRGTEGYAPHLSSELNLDFLAPTDVPGHLGRLGHYDVMHVIGRGGMGVVIKGFDTHLQRPVALKVMATQLADDETSRKRFCREARAAAAITHEHVVAVYHVEREEGINLPFLVMQLVNGESLEKRLERVGRMPLVDIVRIGKEIASGLAAAHAQGLIHRDIKPDNILLEMPGDRVKLTDFGLARAAEDVKLTQSGMIAGTPAFMSPEQAKGEPLDHRSDLFSLGSVLYTMAAGREPFEGSSSFIILRKITEENPRPIVELNPDAARWMTDIIEKLHAKKPEERFQSAQQVADILQHQLVRLQSGEAPAMCPIKRRQRRIQQAIWAGAGAAGLLGCLILSEATGLTRFFLPGRPAITADDSPSAALRSTFNGNAGPVRSAVFSPDGASLAMANDDGTIKIWDVKAGSILATLNAHKGTIWAAAFSPDGNRLATAGDEGAVKLWDTASWKEIHSIAHDSSVRGVVFSPDDKRIVTGTRNGDLVWWDADSGKELKRTAAHAGIVTAVALSRDGKMIASASGDKTVKVWDVASGQERISLQGHTGGVYTVAFSPDARKIATGSWDKTVKIWDVATGSCLATLPGHTQDVWSVVFSPDGRTLASAAEDKTVKVWDVAAARELATFKGHTGTLYSVTYSPDGATIASGGRDGTVRLWTSPRSQ